MVKKVVVLVAVMCVATAAWAGPKDKLKGSVVSVESCTGSTHWDWQNDTVVATIQADSKKMKVKWKGTGADLNGKTVYCFLGADNWLGNFAAVGPVANALIMKGTVEDGKLSLSGTVASVAADSLPDMTSFNSTVECYVDAADTYASNLPLVAGINNAAACPVAIWIPQDTVNFKDDSIVGVCQGGPRDPNSPFIAVYPDPNGPLAVSGLGSYPEIPSTGAGCP
jgi:hypothetical protein